MNIALVFAGGTGQRMNAKAKPKQFLSLHGKSIILHTLEWFENHSEIDKIVVVCLESWSKNLEAEIEKFSFKKIAEIVIGGKTGQESIYNGLKAIKEMKDLDDNTIIMIHDGVRPLIDETIISKNIATVKEKGNAITVVNAIETIASVDETGVITFINDRKKMKVAKAPQSFYFKDIYEAHEKAREENITNFTDSATLLSNYGHVLNTVMGSPENIKITTASDFYIFRALCEARENSQILGV